MNNSNGMGSRYYGRSRLNIDNATVTVNNSVYVGESTGDPQIHVKNGGAFLCNRRDNASAGDGFQIGRNGDAAADVAVSASTLGAYNLYVRKGSSLAVTNGSTLKLDTMHKNFINTAQAGGSVIVDNATISPYSTGGTGVFADWFRDFTGSFSIGAGGVTFTTPHYAFFGATPTNCAAGAALTKTGAGTLSLAAGSLPVTVNEGALRLSVAQPGPTNALTGAITFADGTALEVGAEMALGAMTVNADAATFDAFGLEQVNAWSVANYAHRTADGLLSATDGVAWKDTGSSIAFTGRTVRVDRSFTLAFDTVLASVNGTPAKNWTVILRKDPTAPLGTKEYSGYGGVANTFGVGVDAQKNYVRFGTNGAIRASFAETTAFRLYSTDRAAPCRCRVAYDAVAKRVTFTVRNAESEEKSWTYDVDLAACIGAETATLAFGGGFEEGGRTEFVFTNVRFTEAAPALAAVARVGGAMTLAAGDSFAATLRPNEFIDGFLMDRLDYADGATLDVASDANLRPAPALTLDDHSLWTLSGGAYWREDGSLATSRLLADGSTKQDGSATTVGRYAVDSDWRLAFTFDLGAHSVVAPADYLDVRLQDASGNGLGLRFRYYEDIRTVTKVDETTSTTNTVTYRKSQLQLMRRGVKDTEQSVLDLDPIDFTKYGAAAIAMAYDAAAQTLTVDLSQQDGARTRQVVLTNVDMKAILADNTRAQFRFTGEVGGYYSENVVSDLVFSSDADAAERAAVPGFFGFARSAGAGTLVKTGAADLGLVDDAAKDVALRLAGGGLRLRREAEEDVVMGDVPNGWAFSHASGRYIANGIQIGKKGEKNHKSTAQLRHRVRMDGDWDCAFTVNIDDAYSADAFSFFFHNDPRGPQCVGDNAGFSGIKNGFPVSWYFYRHNEPAYCRMNASSMNYTEGTSQSFAPLKLNGNTTDVALAYRAAEKTLTCVMTQGATVVTNTFTNLDIVSAVKDTSAWMGFGVGSGGVQALLSITNFRYTRHATEAATDQNATRYLASVAVAEDATVRLETTKANATFRLADAVTVADGRTLAAASLNAPATLAMGALTLGAESALAGDGATTVSPDALAGELDALTLKGVTLAVPETAIAARSLSESTIALMDGARLAVPAGRVLSVRAVFVDGVKQGAGVYAAGAADWVSSGSVVIGGGTVFILR